MSYPLRETDREHLARMRANNAQRPGLTREGPTQGEQQIIGVELAVTREGQRETELDMFQCKHTIPRASYSMPEQVRVTIHTSDGDVTLISGRGFTPGTYYIS